MQTRGFHGPAASTGAIPCLCVEPDAGLDLLPVLWHCMTSHKAKEGETDSQGPRRKPRSSRYRLLEKAEERTELALRLPAQYQISGQLMSKVTSCGMLNVNRVLAPPLTWTPQTPGRSDSTPPGAESALGLRHHHGATGHLPRFFPTLVSHNHRASLKTRSCWLWHEHPGSVSTGSSKGTFIHTSVALKQSAPALWGCHLLGPTSHVSLE